MGITHKTWRVKSDPSIVSATNCVWGWWGSLDMMEMSPAGAARPRPDHDLVPGTGRVVLGQTSERPHALTEEPLWGTESCELGTDEPPVSPCSWLYFQYKIRNKWYAHLYRFIFLHLSSLRYSFKVCLWQNESSTSSVLIRVRSEEDEWCGYKE